MRQIIINTCYVVLKMVGLSKPIATILSKRLKYESKQSYKQEFDNDYLMVVTKARSQILFNKTLGSAYLQSGYWEAESYEYCVLRALWVHNLVKKRGVGARIVHEVVSNAKKLGFKHIILTSNSDNATAQRLYERCGFVKYHEEMDMPNFEKERDYMEKITLQPQILYVLSF